MSDVQHTRVVIVGAGMSGSLLAIYLARRGYHIEVYDQRSDIQELPAQSTLSINMTFATRGLQALAAVGLYDQVMQRTVPLEGRMVHTKHNTLRFQPYGKDAGEVVHTIKRNHLNALLVQHAQTFPNVTFYFHQRCLTVERDEQYVTFSDERSQQLRRVSFDMLVGADGVFSTVRQAMHHKERSDYAQSFIGWGYKNLTIRIPEGGEQLLDRRSFHMWPRGNFMLMAVPNTDGSFACLCVLPLEGAASFASLQTDEQIRAFFSQHFADALPFLPDLIQEFRHHPTGSFMTLSTSPWFYQSSIVLIGDACHSFVPFYGQGMNASLEDCQILDTCMHVHQEHRESAFARYQQLRKRHTDVMAELSLQNFVEIRARVQSPLFLLQKKVDLLFHRLFPRWWVPLYTLIMHTTIPYADALERFKRQERLKEHLKKSVGVVGMATLIAIVHASVRRIRR